MPISVTQWRLEIGKFYNFSVKHLKVIKPNKLEAPFFNINVSLRALIINLFFLIINVIMRVAMLMIYNCQLYQMYVCLKAVYTVFRYCSSYILHIFTVYLLYHTRLIRVSDDIELNPGPKPSSFQNFSICHWNLNSITSHDFLKVKLLSAYNILHNFDIICISESYLNSETVSNDDSLNIPSYNMVRVDHPSGNRRGGVCVYYKETLPIKMLDINYLQECICFDLKTGSKL